MGCYSIAGLPPNIKFAGTHLYTWVERGTVKVKCLAQEHNTMSPARARTRTTRSGVERTNREATAPPTLSHLIMTKLRAHSIRQKKKFRFEFLELSSGELNRNVRKFLTGNLIYIRWPQYVDFALRCRYTPGPCFKRCYQRFSPKMSGSGLGITYFPIILRSFFLWWSLTSLCHARLCCSAREKRTLRLE